MQYVMIKREEKDGKEYFAVNAIPLKNTNKTVVPRIPHPLGADVITFDTLEEAKDAVTRAGFSYILPNGEKGSKSQARVKVTNTTDYSEIVFEAVKDKINSSNEVSDEVKQMLSNSLNDIERKYTFQESRAKLENSKLFTKLWTMFQFHHPLNRVGCVHPAQKLRVFCRISGLRRSRKYAIIVKMEDKI